jgi:predicted nucleic acid-binding protein
LAVVVEKSKIETVESSSKVIGPYDLIVAATALERDSGVAIFNKHPFANVKGLKVIEPK